MDNGDKIYVIGRRKTTIKSEEKACIMIIIQNDEAMGVFMEDGCLCMPMNECVRACACVHARTCVCLSVS